MEVLVEQPPLETKKSFNPVASVDMMRYDLRTFGEILPETVDRIRDEELSYFVEAVDRAARTVFALQRQGEQLMYFDRGTWRPYIGTLVAGLEVAEQEATQDPRRNFLAAWARENLAQGYQMQALKPGEQMVWYSAYAEQEEMRYGAGFMRSCGLIPERKMGFLYRATCADNGTVVLESQTVDRSSEAGFHAAMQASLENPHITMDELVERYDAVLETSIGGEFYAGRQNAEHNENAWNVIEKQKDLIMYFLTGLEKLAASSLYGNVLERAIKKHVYGSWAAFKKRLDGQDLPQGRAQHAYNHDRLMHEVQTAFNDFASRGQVLVGCGGAIDVFMGEDSMMAADVRDVFSAIFGINADEDKYGSLRFRCQRGHMNKRPRNKLIPKCKTCGISVKC